MPSWNQYQLNKSEIEFFVDLRTTVPFLWTRLKSMSISAGRRLAPPLFRFFHHLTSISIHTYSQQFVFCVSNNKALGSSCTSVQHN